MLMLAPSPAPVDGVLTPLSAAERLVCWEPERAWAEGAKMARLRWCDGVAQLLGSPLAYQDRSWVWTGIRGSHSYAWLDFLEVISAESPRVPEPPANRSPTALLPAGSFVLGPSLSLRDPGWVTTGTSMRVYAGRPCPDTELNDDERAAGVQVQGWDWPEVSGWHPQAFASAMTHLRERAGLSWRRAAEALGTNTGTLWRVEHAQGKRPPSPELILAVAEVYGVPLWQLLRVCGRSAGALEQAWEARYGLPVKDFWRTPPAVFAHYNRQYRYQVDLAALAAHSLCERCIGPHEDALSPETDWRAAAGLPDGVLGFGWLNPPYSRVAGSLLSWVERAVDELDRLFGSSLLVPPSMSTEYMQLLESRGATVDFFRKRLSFVHPITGAVMKGNRGDSCVATLDPRHEGSATLRYVDVVGL